jgi:hypothetical protein
MVLLIASVVLFVGIGLFLIIRREQAARGFGLVMGATTPRSFMVLLGVAFIGFAVWSIVLYAQGVLH